MEKELERTEGRLVKSLAGSNFGDVMIVGGGISGIQAALDLGTAGFKVYLVDKAPTIGGHMSQLDKTFPTNDCSMCIESPKFTECNRHPNIEIMTYTEVDSVEGETGDFKVTLIKKPRYVNESKCTGCTVCVEYCPAKYPDQFNQELSDNKAIHIHFSQATPLVTYIDESCRYLKDKTCTVCQGVCKADAIDFNQKAEKVEIKVGAIVLSPGFEPFDPKLRQDYGYGKFKNVVTSLDYERLLCSTGPYEGEILRASDKKHPHKVAWIQCVGSRQVIPGGNSYCSAVCCTYAQKQVILTKDHDAEAECTIFHNDIRSYGKDFERFYQRTEKLPGVRFIRSYTSIGKEIPESKNVTIRYSTPDDGVKEEEFDMVVLSVGLNPPAVISAFEEEIRKQSLEAKVELRATGCHGFCEKGPIVVIYPEEICYLEVAPEDVPEIVSKTLVDKKVIDRLVYTDPNTGEKAAHQSEIPFYKNQTRLLIGNSPKINPKSIDDYLAIGGYSALAKALFEMSPEQVLEEIKKANLRGRGGGGFPAGSKWETTRNAPGEIKYVIVNAHEGEPGAFMDRALFTGNPHMVLEGLIIGAYAIGSKQGFIYTRHDTPQLRENLDLALAKAQEYGLLGENILGSGFSFNVEVHLDVGIFVSGESSALMRSIEGKAPEPRPKYIRTSVSGIWDKPSNLNNVETWANVPQIINKGSQWYSSIGTERSKGTKLISISGHICNSGVVEVPMGTSLREIVYDFGGGIPNGKKLKAIHFGGPMGGSIPESLIDTPLDFDALSKLGASLGAGDMLVLDEDTCMVEIARYFLEFLSGESCGKCVPCRESMRQMLKILTNMTKGKGKEGDLELLEELAFVVSEAALCSLGRSIQKPLLSMLKYFRAEFEAHIKEKRCPALSCKELSASEGAKKNE